MTTQFIFLIRYCSCFILSPAESNFLSEANQEAEKEAATQDKGEGEGRWNQKMGGDMNKKLIVILVLVGLALILIFQNTQSVYLHIFFWKLVQPMVVLVVTLFALGFVIGFLAAKMKGPRDEKP